MTRQLTCYSPNLTHQRGYALLLMLVLVTMGILFTVVNQVSLVGMKMGRAQGTNTALLQAKEALIGYAATYRDAHSGEVFGYLPCPDIDGDGDADPVNNDANCAASDQIVVGLLPYKTLGLSDLRDATGECLWYAVSPGFKASMSKVEPMNWDTRGQIEIRDNDSTTKLADPIDGIEGGAAAVVFAAGPPLVGNTVGRGDAPTKTCTTNGKAHWAAYLEGAVFDKNGNSSDNPLIVVKGLADDSKNNDQIVWISPKEIFDKIKARTDRGSLNTLSALIASDLRSKINSDLVNGTAPITALPTRPSPVSGAYSGQVGEVPAVELSDDDEALLKNWHNQYRYAVCNDLCGYCLTMGGQRCNGALMFGAAHTSGGPRARQPTTLEDLFENDSVVGSGDGKGGLALLGGETKEFSGAPTYAGSSADVGICVAPIDQKPTTFSCDLASADNASLDLGGGTRLVTTSDGVLTLGQNLPRPLITPGSQLFGCDWLPQVENFGTGVRVYFKFTIVQSGRGFVFAIIDGSQYPAGFAPCGKSNQLLGYAGDNGITIPIKPPKIGLEIHTTNAFTQGSPGYQHAALVYWGNDNTTATNDDNHHGALNALAGYPLNPSAPPGVSGNLGATGTNVLATGNTVHVRLDIVRNYDATTRIGSYSLKAWLVKSPTTALLADLLDMTQDFSSSSSGALAATVSNSFTTANLPTGAISDPEALQKIRFGFTTGQGTSTATDQVLTIPTFIAVPR